MTDEKDILDEIEEIGKKFEHKTAKSSKAAFARYPITFTILSVFGFLAVQAGFINLTAKITFLNNNPWILIFIGLMILIATGTFYKWLHNKPLT